MRKKVLGSFFILLFSLNAQSEALSKYYSNIYSGEKSTPNYAGPLDPRANFNYDKSELVLMDDHFANHTYEINLQPEAFELSQFWISNVLDKSTCPNDELSENIDYIQYLYRLVTVSYLFESLKLNHRISSELNLGTKSCNLSFSEVFGKCEPKSDDMKKFKERVYGKFVNEFEKIKYSSLSSKEIESWLELFHLSSTSTLDPTFSRLQSWCKANGKNCKSINIQDLKLALNSFCESDKKLMNLTCNETDSLYGLSYVPAASELVKKSSAFNLINTKGMGEDCLRRYTKSNIYKELIYDSLPGQFNSLYKYLESEKSSYIQGALFLPGALKEFDMKGLSDFLVALKPPKVEPIKIAKVKPKPKPKPEIKKVEEKVVVKQPEPVQPVVIEPELPKISEFEHAVSELETKGLANVWIDMDKFREDFEFTSKMISNLSMPIKKFQTRQALKDMKDFDRFGQKEAPVGIIFLKFLIDTDNHQGLYNVINVLGEKFYVNNDFEGKSHPVYAQVKNDASTKHRWQIILFQPEKKTEVKK